MDHVVIARVSKEAPRILEKMPPELLFVLCMASAFIALFFISRGGGWND